MGGSNGVSAEWHLINASSFPGQQLATSAVRQAPEDHYNLLLRCWRTDASKTLRWMHTSHPVRFNEAHRWRGHVFQGRFKSVLIRTVVEDPAKARQVVMAAAQRARHDWQEILSAAESIRGRLWKEARGGHGDWGPGPIAAVATRRLGWRLVAVAGRMPGVKRGSLAQGGAVLATGRGARVTEGVRGTDLGKTS